MTDEDRARITQDAEVIAATDDDDLPVRMDGARMLEILNASSAAQNAQREVARLIRREAYDRGLAEGLRAARLDAMTRAAYEDGKGDGRAEGRRQAAAKIALEIRRELVCCDIYERDAGTERAGQTHAICFWGEAGARIAEAVGNGDRDDSETTGGAT